MSGILDVLLPAFPAVIVTETSSDRALPAAELASLVREKLAADGRDEGVLQGVYGSVGEALASLDAERAPFVAAGTITLAGEVAGLLRG